MKQNKDKYIGVAPETETYDKLVMLATEDRRTVSNFVRHIIKRYIQGVEDGSTRLSVYAMLRKQP